MGLCAIGCTGSMAEALYAARGGKGEEESGVMEEGRWALYVTLFLQTLAIQRFIVTVGVQTPFTKHDARVCHMCSGPLFVLHFLSGELSTARSGGWLGAVVADLGWWVCPGPQACMGATSCHWADS